MAEDVMEINLDMDGLGKPNVDTKPQEQADAAKAASDKAEADRIAAESATKEQADATAKAIADTEEAKKSGTKPEAVEIDNIKYKLDDKGNALTPTGEIYKTKTELDQMSSEQEAPLVDVLIQKSGYIPLDDTGKPKVYEDTEEGIIAANLDIAKMMAIKEREELINSDPELQRFVDYRKRTGGRIEDFVQKETQSWRAVKLDDSNEEMLMKVVIADLVAGGQDEDQARLTAEMYKDTKKLKDFGKAAYKRLTTNEEVTEKEEEEAYKTEIEEQTKKIEEHWGLVKETITKGSINGIVIPEADKDAFFKYTALNADGKGNSQLALDKSKMKLEQLLQLDYLIFKGMDVSKLVQNAIKTANATSLRSRINKDSKSGAGGGEGIDQSKYKRSNGLDGLSLDKFL